MHFKSLLQMSEKFKPLKYFLLLAYFPIKKFSAQYDITIP